jgi:tRNA A-37 threonylcarbamoyl transferase component Bud32
VTLVAQERRVGPWALGERIGGGGQAAVYRVRHAVLARPAALKLVHPAVWADPAFRVRFRRECDALVALEHPGIVPILDAGEHEGRGYLVMPLARGGSLDARIARAPLAPAEAVAVIAAVASALDAAHAAGVLHRDVTPSNVLLDPLGPWLADFGLALRADATTLTAAGQLVGTAGYLAPEVIAGGRATPASDRYALAATAFRILTGASPFDAAGIAGMLHAHATAVPRRATAVRPGLPAGLDPVLAEGLAKDPRDRPPTAGALAESLRAAVAGTGAPTRALTRRPPVRRRRRPRRRTVVAGALALAVLAGAGGAAAALTLAGGAASGPPAPPAVNARVTIAETVPGPDGAGVRADPAIASDLPGGVAIPGAISADVGPVRVTAAPGGRPTLAAARARLEAQEYVSEPLSPDGVAVGQVARRLTILDVLGQSDRWALLVLTESTGERAVLVRGRGEAAADYAEALARARAGQVVPPG